MCQLMAAGALRVTLVLGSHRPAERRRMLLEARKTLKVPSADEVASLRREIVALTEELALDQSASLPKHASSRRRPPRCCRQSRAFRRRPSPCWTRS